MTLAVLNGLATQMAGHACVGAQSSTGWSSSPQISSIDLAQDQACWPFKHGERQVNRSNQGCQGDTSPKCSSSLRECCTSKPAMMPMVVGRLAAQTPSRLRVRSSIPEATTRGGAQAKQAVRPGCSSCMWPETASSDTPDSSHVWSSSRHTCRILQCLTQGKGKDQQQQQQQQQLPDGNR